MNKKGAELSMNVIIISILVILVLVVLAAFFLSGTSNLFSKISGVAPDNLEIAVSNCQSKCQLAQTFQGDVARGASSYCRYEIDVDTNDDNIADQKHHCWSSEIGMDCPGVDNVCQKEFNDYEQIET